MDKFVFPQDRKDGEAGLARAGGLQLRDYFAAHVVPPLIERYSADTPEFCVDRAYELADYMIKARKR